MRLYQHLFYAVMALIGVTLIALQDPSVGIAMATISEPAASAPTAHTPTGVCRDDRLERPCNPRIQVAGIMQDGRVFAR